MLGCCDSSFNIGRHSGWWVGAHVLDRGTGGQSAQKHICSLVNSFNVCAIVVSDGSYNITG